MSSVTASGNKNISGTRYELARNRGNTWVNLSKGNGSTNNKCNGFVLLTKSMNQATLPAMTCVPCFGFRTILNNILPAICFPTTIVGCIRLPKSNFVFLQYVMLFCLSTINIVSNLQQRILYWQYILVVDNLTDIVTVINIWISRCTKDDCSVYLFVTMLLNFFLYTIQYLF